MRRRQKSSDDANKSDASYSPTDEYNSDDLFDVNESQGVEVETEATNINDQRLDSDAGYDDVDIEDQIQLFGGNVNPPEYYRQAIEEFNTSVYEAQDYCDGSLLLLDACEEQWRQYCRVLHRDPQECFKSISNPTSLPLLKNFFEWRLNQKVGKNGRKMRGTKTSSSLGTYWKVFRLVFERATGDKLDSKINRYMHQVLRKLRDKHRLSDEKRMNRCMTIEDLKEQIETTISTTKKSFQLGELRIRRALPPPARPCGSSSHVYFTHAVRRCSTRDSEGSQRRTA